MSSQTTGVRSPKIDLVRNRHSCTNAQHRRLVASAVASQIHKPHQQLCGCGVDTCSICIVFLCTNGLHVAVEKAELLFEEYSNL